MKKIKINMLSSADKIDGQGVGSAFLEQVALIKEGANDMFDVSINGFGKFDILHIHTIGPINFIRMKMSNVVNVCYVHFLPDTLDGSISLPKILFNIFKKYVINFYKKTDYVIVVNPIFMDALMEYGIAKEKIVYIPNYVSKEHFYRKDDDEIFKFKESYGIAPTAFVVMAVGQVQTRKGVLDFVEVAKQLPDISFLWCGGFSFGHITDGYRELTKIVDQPPKNVKFTGIIPRKSMNDMYNIADVLFMPSYNELFPMSILEAVNLHKPLVLRKLKLYEDILFHKYMAGENNQDFTNLLTALKKDKTLYAKGVTDAKYISAYYTKGNVLNIWIDFYTKVYNDHKHNE